MQYCIYLRKSRKDDELEALGEGDTLARHRKILLDYAAKHKLVIGQIYEEVVSGDTIAARPVMQKLLEDVSAEMWNGVLVIEIERLARGDTMDQGLVAQTFKFSNTKIITPVKTYDPNNEFDEEYFEFGLFMSRREYKTINRRLQRGRMTSINEGKWVANKAPYGYERYKLEGEKGFSLRMVEPEASVVKYIFELYTIGEQQEDGKHNRLGCSKIARRLNDNGIQTMTGAKWTIATVRDMLKNPVYMGKIRWGRRATEKRMENGKIVKVRGNLKYGDYLTTEGRHGGIVSEETFLKAQEMLSKNPPRPLGEKGSVTNPLAGLVVCEMCGHHMQRRPFTNKTPASINCTTLGCDCVSARFDLVETRVLEALQSWLDKYYIDIKSAKEQPPKPENNITKTLLQAAEKELERLERQKARIFEAYENEVYDSQTFIERSKENAEKISATTNRIAELRKIADTEINRQERFALLIPRIEHILKVYDKIDAKEKNEYLSEVIERITYIRTEGGRWTGVYDNFEIGVFPRI